MTKDEYEKDQARLREEYWDDEDKRRDALYNTLRRTPCALCGETPADDNKLDVPSCLAPYPGQWVHGRQGYRLCGDCIPIWHDAQPEPCKNGFYPEWYDKQTLQERLAYHQTMAMVQRRVTGWKMKPQ